MKAKIDDYSWPGILLIGEEIEGRTKTAMLMGACFWTIEHLEKVLPMYSERLDK